MSIETTLARAGARHAAAAWRGHCRNCPRCARSARTRTGPGPCRPGTPLYLAHESARRDLAASIALDKRPMSGQGALF